MLIGVTGSSGILGKELLKYINSKNNNIRSFKGNIEKKNELHDWLKKNNFDVIIHLAAIVPINQVKRTKIKAKKVNFLGTKNLIECIKKIYNKKKIWFFFSSTSHVYGYSKSKFLEKDNTIPLNYYAKTKLMSEKLIIKNEKFYTYCIGRIFSFTSRRQSQDFFIPDVIKKIKSKENKIKFSNVNHYRDFLSLEDICRAINILMKKKANGIYNICSSQKILLSDIIKTLNFKKKKLIFNKNKNQTTLVGSNYKLKRLKWKIKHKNYLNYIKNINIK